MLPATLVDHGVERLGQDHVRSRLGGTQAEAHEILRDRDANSPIYPSDHYPTLATMVPA